MGKTKVKMEPIYESEDGIIFDPGDKVKLRDLSFRSREICRELGLGSDPILTTDRRLKKYCGTAYMIREFKGTRWEEWPIHRFFLELVERAISRAYPQEKTA